MHFSPSTIAAMVIAGSFAAGLNVYATVLTLGVLARMHWAVLPGNLEVLSSWWVIGASAALFAAEFIADKIPAFDMVWNALQTFVRVPIAALLAYGATTHLTPPMQLLAVTGGSLIAMVAHGSKTAVRAAITPSPEPVSNIALSSTEDAAAIGLSWLVTVHPWVSASIALVGIVIGIIAIRWVIRACRRMFQRAGNVLLPQAKSA